MLFVNQTGLPDDQVFLTFQDPSQTLSATYGGGTTVSRATAGDVMTNSYSLTQLGSGGFNISNASSVVMFVSYAATVANNGFDMSGDLSGNAEPSYIGTGGTNYSKAYQPFEITAVNGATNGQGNLTNINYFTAPISVQTYHGGANGTLLQSRGYFGNTATGTAAIANQLAALTRGPNSSLATATLNGNVLRYIGPSSYGAGTNPYPTFNSYLGALNTSGQVTKIQNSNAFNTQANPTTGNLNYNYTLDFQATVAADNTITLSGNIYTTITPFGGAPYAGTTYTGASMTISPTIGANTNSAIFNNTIYGQADPLGSGKGSTTFNSVWGQLATDMANAGLYLNTAAGGGPGTTYGTTQSLAIGEITTGLLGGFAGSNAVYQSGSDTGPYAQYNGMLYKDSAERGVVELDDHPFTLDPAAVQSLLQRIFGRNLQRDGQRSVFHPVQRSLRHGPSDADAELHRSQHKNYEFGGYLGGHARGSDLRRAGTRHLCISRHGRTPIGRDGMETRWRESPRPGGLNSFADSEANRRRVCLPRPRRAGGGGSRGEDRLRALRPGYDVGFGHLAG